MSIRTRDELYEYFGWERCYHRGGAGWHYNVKTGGGGAYRAYRDIVNRRNLADEALLDLIAEAIWEGELQSWWDGVADEYGPGVYSCGRSGGYVNARHLENDAVAMKALGEHCAASREYYNGPLWGEYVAELALEEYDAAKLAELASPRIERIEA